MVMSEDLTQKLPTSQDPALAQILSAVQNLGTGLGNLENRFESLERKVEERLYDTRPIWEKVQADIVQLQEGQQRVEEGQESLRKDVRDVRTELRDMNRKFSIFNDNLVQIQADYRDIYDRVRDLERQQP
jgi:chromosome segregation ATPase